jgi:hypothetical protein
MPLDMNREESLPLMQSPALVSKQALDYTSNILGSPISGRGPETLLPFTAFLLSMLLFRLLTDRTESSGTQQA